MGLFFSQLSKRDSVRSTLAAVVLLQLKFSRPFTNVISFKALYGIQPWVFHFLSNQAKSQFAIFQVLLFLRTTGCFQFLCTEYGTVWGITQCSSICIFFVCTIIKLVKLNNFKYPTKIRLCSQANQNHLLRDFVSFSACRYKWKQLAGTSFVILVRGEIWMFHVQRRRR